MYGTVSRFQFKGDVTEDQIQETIGRIRDDRPSGAVGVTVYRSDNDPKEMWICGVFESREAYAANSNTPEQHERFLRLQALAAGPPEWHDGEVVLHVANEVARS